MIDNNSIEEYINVLRSDELNFKTGNDKDNPTSYSGRSKLYNRIKIVVFIFKALIDYVALRLSLLRRKNREKRIVFTAYNFTNNVNGKIEDRIVKPLFTDDILFINQSKEVYIKKINNQRVYNLGGLAKLLHVLYVKDTFIMQYFKAYRFINGSFLNRFNNKEVYLLWFYDLNSLSIIFSKFRSRLILIEVQHGAIINYPPYVKPSPVKIADRFYVKNQATIDYLKSHLCRDFECEYHLIPYPKNKRKHIDGTHILYASFANFNSIHPAFLRFLKDTTIKDLDIHVRLHPRERTPETEELFRKQISECGKEFQFDRTKNWLEDNTIENLIVISPCSSSIEDAYDNGYKTIIIDPAGKKRFAYLIDNERCFFSEDIEKTLTAIAKK